MSSLVASRSSVWPGSSPDSAWGALKIAKVAYKWLRSMVYGRYKMLVGGFNPSEKYESQLGLLFPIYGNIKNVPNHQPVELDNYAEWG